MSALQSSAASLRRLSTPVILVAVLGVIALITELRGDVVFERVVTVMLINLLLAVALQVFMGNSGLGSFGQYSFVTIGAYATIWFSLTSTQKRVALPDMPREWWLYKQHLGFVPSVLIGAAVATVVGALIGVALVRLRGASFTIATFAFLIVVNRVALQWEEVTRGSRTVIGIPKYTGLWTALTWAAIAVVVAFIFKESPLGLKLRASREDEDAAASLGVNAALMRWVAFVLSVFLSGLAGGLWAHFIQQFSPHNFYLKETFLIVAMLIIGGAGSVSGAVFGAIAVALTSEWLRQIENWVNIQRSTKTTIGNMIPFQLVGFTEIIVAVAMISVLIVRPSGLTGGREIVWPAGGLRRRRDRAVVPSEAGSGIGPS
ncbi:MAG: branched-chain amino acid transport system permease protein [Thermomicrobiales bacterium]|nr:branched-chain amino acid transport system permease protein [Thermomicrobiales bacterium]